MRVDARTHAIHFLSTRFTATRLPLIYQIRLPLITNMCSFVTWFRYNAACQHYTMNTLKFFLGIKFFFDRAQGVHKLYNL